MFRRRVRRGTADVSCVVRILDAVTGLPRTDVTANDFNTNGPQYYVSTSGNDGNLGTIGSPWRHLAVAIPRLTAGDTLNVRSGTYDEGLVWLENMPSGTSWSNKVTIKAYQGETVVIKPTTGDRVLGIAGATNGGNNGVTKYIEWNGIIFDGTGGVALGVITIETGSTYTAHHIRFIDCEIIGVPNPSQQQQNPGSTSCLFIGGVNCSRDVEGGNEVQYCTIHGGGQPSPGADFATMCYFQTSDNVVENCLIYDGVGAGVELNNVNAGGASPQRNIIRNNIIRDFTRNVTGTRGDGIICGIDVNSPGNTSPIPDTQIYNNIISNIANTHAASAGIQIFYGTRTLIYNNTVYGCNQKGIWMSNNATVTATAVRNNISYLNGTNYLDQVSGTTQDHNLFGTNPLFVNPISGASGDFHLQNGSPAADAGIASFVSTDKDGVARNNPPEIGAYEKN